ncbi:MAG: DUF3892 domain-containing protein [Oscillospiraceae bacterium]
MSKIEGGPKYMVYIDAVHYETDSHDCEVITKLKWTNVLSEQATDVCTKQQMIDFINRNSNDTKTKYLINNGWSVLHWTSGEDVRVVDNSYLRTDSNQIKNDNLGNLPRF